jgi:hypothetical protein
MQPTKLFTTSYDVYQISTSYFCAAVIVNGNIITIAAPILKWSIGKRFETAFVGQNCVIEFVCTVQL